MKTRTLTVLFSAVLLLAGAARLGAQPANTPYDGYFSLNVLGQDYRNAAEREDVAKNALAAATYDVNHDGKLDEKEFAAWQKRVRSFVEQQPALMKKFDRNRDGWLNDAEWHAAYDVIFETKPAPTGAMK